MSDTTNVNIEGNNNETNIVVDASKCIIKITEQLVAGPVGLPGPVSLESKKNSSKPLIYYYSDDFTFELIRDSPITNKEWRKMLLNTRKALVGVDKGVYSQRINKILKRDLRDDISSHDLRSMYGVYRFNTENDDKQNLTGYIAKILNHNDSSDSGIAYSNISFVEK